MLANATHTFPTKRFQATLTAALLLASLSASGCNQPRQRPAPSRATLGRDQPMPGVLAIRVAVINPRAVGKKSFIHIDKKRRETRIVATAVSPHDTTVQDYRIEMIKLIAFADGSAAQMVIQTSRPEYGRLGYLSWQEGREPPVVVIGAVADQTSIAFASNAAWYVFLVRGLDEDTDWRLLRLSQQNIDDAVRTTLVVPDLLTLPLVKDQPESRAWWTAHAHAAEAYKAAVAPSK